MDDEDRSDLVEAVGIMADVAAFINESKRRKDIGMNYEIKLMNFFFFKLKVVSSRVILLIT